MVNKNTLKNNPSCSRSHNFLPVSVVGDSAPSAADHVRHLPLDLVSRIVSLPLYLWVRIGRALCEYYLIDYTDYIIEDDIRLY